MGEDVAAGGVVGGAGGGTVSSGCERTVHCPAYRGAATPAAYAALAGADAVTRQSTSLTASYQIRPMMSGCRGSCSNISVIQRAFWPELSVAAVSVITTGFWLKARSFFSVGSKICSKEAYFSRPTVP